MTPNDPIAVLAAILGHFVVVVRPPSKLRTTVVNNSSSGLAGCFALLALDFQQIIFLFHRIQDKNPSSH
jgi:hypothetical protein